MPSSFEYRRVLVIGGGFAGLSCARDLASRFLVTLVDAKEFFEYTPGILRAFVQPKRLDALTFTFQPVLERHGCRFIWGEVQYLDGPERTATIRPMYSDDVMKLSFDFCIVATGCNFGPFHKWGDSLWAPTVHEKALRDSKCHQFDPRFLEGRRRNILQEHAHLQALNEKGGSVLVVGAGYIGVEWVTELRYYFPQLFLTIIDYLPNCLGPLPQKAVDYCTQYMDKSFIKQFYYIKYEPGSRKFWCRILLPKGPDREYVCMGVKACNYFMPRETLSPTGPGGGGWILIDSTLAVKTRWEQRWSVEAGFPRIFAVGDCVFPGIEEVGKPPHEWPIPPIPKVAYPAEEEAVIVSTNVRRIDNFVYKGKHTCCGRPLELNSMHWPWGSGIFSISLGPIDGCFIAGSNWKRGSGLMLSWGCCAALLKQIIEVSKVDESANGLLGRALWHFVHHTPVHMFGQGPLCGYHS